MALSPPSGTISPEQSTIAQVLSQVEQLRRSGRIADAERLCGELVAANPAAAGPLNSLAIILAGAGRSGEAKILLERAIAAEPRDASPHNNLGIVLGSLNEKAAAEAAFRRAIRLNANYPEAYYSLGNLLHEMNRAEEALAAHRRAVMLRPSYVQALVRVGVLLAEGGAHREALAPLETALALEPKYFDALYYWGTILVELERFNEALVALNKAIAARPERYEGHYALGNLLMQTRREEDAFIEYRRVLEIAPQFVPAHRAYNNLAWSLGRTDVYLASYKEARDRIGDQPDNLLAEAEERLRMRDNVVAEDLLRRAEKVAPGRTDIANALARALLEQGHTGRGIDLLYQTVQRDPVTMQHRHELGAALLRAQDAKGAVAVLEDALLIAPYDQMLLSYLSLAYRQTGDARFERLVDHERYVRAFDLPLPNNATDMDAFNRELAGELKRLHTTRVEPVSQSLRSGTQTTGHLFGEKTPAIVTVRVGIENAISKYIADLGDDASHPLLARKDRNFHFTGSWSCQLRSSGYHSNHIHSKGWISSAYYVELPAVVSNEADKQGWLKFGESNMALGSSDAAARIVQPRIGKLVLFPSYFWHGTVPFKSDEMRLTVAFDVAPGKPLTRLMT